SPAVPSGDLTRPPSDLSRGNRVGGGARQYDGFMSERPGLRAWVSRAIGVLLLVPVAILGLLGVQAPWSPSGWVVLAAAAVAAASAFAGSARVRRTLRAAAAAAIGVLVIVRLL